MVVRRTRQYNEWFDRLRDQVVRKRILRRLDKLIARGQFGATRNVGETVWEMKLDFGPGYRIYYTLRGKEIVLLLIGGDKSTQTRDILYARRLAHELKEGVRDAP